jgi:drug/metabolite transporter (DMT)-like permease
LPYTIALAALRKLSAFYVQLATNLEPVYAIALAIVLLGEQRDLGVMFYLGVAIILMSVFAHPLLARTGTRVEHAEMVAVAEAKNVAD